MVRIPYSLLTSCHIGFASIVPHLPVHIGSHPPDLFDSHSHWLASPCSHCFASPCSHSFTSPCPYSFASLVLIRSQPHVVLLGAFPSTCASWELFPQPHVVGRSFLLYHLIASHSPRPYDYVPFYRMIVFHSTFRLCPLLHMVASPLHNVIVSHSTIRLCPIPQHDCAPFHHISLRPIPP